jgi:Carboxypeptidase regulatory-like domain
MRKLSLIILTLILSSVLTFAQTTSGKIIGSVSAPDGVIPGATVTVTDNKTAKVRTVTASDNGTFEVPQLEFGTYTVSITASGYKTFTANEVKIDAGREFSLNALLEVGNVSETVTVTATGEQINASNGELSTTVGETQIRELPLSSRNPLALLNLQAGVNATSSSINGQRTSSVNYTRDGLNVQDNFIRNGFVSDAPTVDNTGEFTVVTQNAGAELGSGSTQVQLVTPRGGNQYHGALYAFNRNSEFAASSFFNNFNGVPRSFLNRNQFGGSFSGPLPVPNFGEGGPLIRRDKSFFFFNYEGFRLAQGVSSSATTLLSAAQNGDFSYVGTDGVTRTVNVLSGTGLNLSTTANATAFANAGGAIPVSATIRSRFLSRIPGAGSPNGLLTGVNYLQAVNFNRADPETRNAFTARVDFDATERSSFNFVFKRNTILDARTDIAAGFSPTVFSSQGGPTHFFVGAWQWALSSNFNNELRGGFQRSEPFFFESNIPSDFLISGTPFTNPEGSFRAQGRNTDYYNVQDNAVYTLGNHSFRAGFQFQRYKVNALNFAGITPTSAIATTSNPNTPGLLGSQFTAINSTDLARANALRYTLGGIIGSTSLTTYYQGNDGYVLGAPQDRKYDYDLYSGYISDQWRFRPNISLNLGLRYEVYTALNDPLLINLEPRVTNPNDVIADLLNPNGVFQIVGTNVGKPGKYFNTDYNNFGPNFSFAYSPKFEGGTLGLLSQGTVIRGGFRVNYNNDEYIRSSDNAQLNNQGLGSQTIGFTNLRASLDPLPGFTTVPRVTAAPANPVIPRPYSANNTAGNGFAGTVSLLDPDLQIQQNLEYNLGIQREIGFKSVFEIRYVGGLSNSLTRSIDYNQLRIRNSRFLADFNTARENCRLQGAIGAPSNTFDTRSLCTSAAYNPSIAGSQPTPYFDTFSSLLTNATILGLIRTGQPGELAQTYLVNNLLTSALRTDLLPNPTAGVANFTTNGGQYRYNSLQAEFRRRFSDGFSYQVNYTFQKILADVVDDGQTRVNPYLDNANIRLDYGRPDYDRTHTVNANFIYELPFGKGKRFLDKGGVLNAIFGGFQFNSIINLSSGIPLGVLDPRGTLNRAGRSGRQSAIATVTADELKNYTGIYKTPNGVFFFNPANLYAEGSNGQRIDLTQQLPAGVTIVSIRGANPIDQAPFQGQLFRYVPVGQTGTLPRNFLNGPAYFNWDAGLSKNFRITENSRLQLRAEMYNVLNHANFAIGDFNINSTSFGRVGSNYTPRIVQFGARFDF